MRIYLCPYCDAQLEEGARYCALCGKEVAVPVAPLAEVAVGDGAQAATAERVAVVDVQPPVLTPAYRAKEQPQPMAADDSALPVSENIAAVISYITILPAAVFLFLQPFRRNRFVRFHAIQHLLLFAAALVGFAAAAMLWMVLQLIPFMRVLVFPFAGLISLAWFFLWVLLVVKAYHHEYFKLPYLGDLTEDLMKR